MFARGNIPVFPVVTPRELQGVMLEILLVPGSEARRLFHQRIGFTNSVCRLRKFMRAVALSEASAASKVRLLWVLKELCSERIYVFS